MNDCFKCDLSIKRNNIVYGKGNKDSNIFIIGEAPGYYEDKHGVPFIGKSGNLLRRYLGYVDIDETNAYFTNVVKCRPPNNRIPSTVEVSTCVKYFLSKEIEVIKPKIIVTVGATSTNLIFGSIEPITKRINKVFTLGNKQVLPIYHPSYILQNGLEYKYMEYIVLLSKNIDKLMFK